jgi:branched-chain amino acid transport system substrate-binding protein
MKRYMICMVPAIALVVLLAGCQQAPKDLKVAILAPLSGPAPTFGVLTRDGALLAVDEWNAKGGVLGRKITTVIEDSQCAADAAVNAANKVINQDHVHYIIGEVCSGASIPVSEIANKQKIIQITPASTNPAVTVDANGKTKEYIFRTVFIDSYQGRVAANFAFTDLKAKTVFFMFDQGNDYSSGLTATFKAEFTKLGGSVAGQESYTKTDADFSAILAKIKTSKAEVVFLPDYYNVANLVTKQAKEKGITAAFIGTDGWESPDLDLKAADGAYFISAFSREDPRPEVAQFFKAYGEKYKDEQGKPIAPASQAVVAYDAMNVLLEGIKAAGVDNTDKVRDALEKIDYKAVAGHITYDAQHNPQLGAIVVQIKNGKGNFLSHVNL